MEEACHRLQMGERLSHHDMTMYRYFCLATLMVTHHKPEKTVVDFKVMYSNVPRSWFLFPCNFDSRTLPTFLCPCAQVTEWNDRELSPGVSATIKFKGGADRAVISTDEDRVSFFYIRVKKLFPQTWFHSLSFHFPPTVVWCLLHHHQAALSQEARSSRE